MPPSDSPSKSASDGEPTGTPALPSLPAGYSSRWLHQKGPVLELQYKWPVWMGLGGVGLLYACWHLWAEAFRQAASGLSDDWPWIGLLVFGLSSYFTVAGLINKTVFQADSHGLVIRFRPLPTWPTRHIGRELIEQIHVEELGTKGGPGSYRLVLTTSTSSQVSLIRGCLDKAVLRELETQLESALELKDRAMGMEAPRSPPSL